MRLVGFPDYTLRNIPEHRFQQCRGEIQKWRSFAFHILGRRWNNKAVMGIILSNNTFFLARNAQAHVYFSLKKKHDLTT